MSLSDDEILFQNWFNIPNFTKVRISIINRLSNRWGPPIIDVELTGRFQSLVNTQGLLKWHHAWTANRKKKFWFCILFEKIIKYCIFHLFSSHARSRWSPFCDVIVLDGAQLTVVMPWFQTTFLQSTTQK